MRRILCISLLFVILFVVVHADSTSIPLLDLREFEVKFNETANTIGSAHKITKNNTKFTSGPINDVFTVYLEESVGMLITVPNGKSNVTEISLMYIPDGNAASATSFIIAIGELALTFGAVAKSKDIGTFIDNLGLFDSDFSDGSSGYVVIKDTRYSWSASSILGIQ